MRRAAASGIATCVRAVSSPGTKASLARVVCQNGRACDPHSTIGMFARSNSTGCPSWNSTAATSQVGRLLSSRSSSFDKASEEVSDSKVGSGQSSTAEATPAKTLVSSEGSSPSLLTGPRITSKKGYLEREGMISETQKAVREYYKEGMYQVSRHVLIRLSAACNRGTVVPSLQQVLY